MFLDPTGSTTATITGLATGAAAAAVTMEPMVPYIGIPLSILLAACAGALISLGHSPPPRPPKLLVAPGDSTTLLAVKTTARAVWLVFALATIAVLASWTVMSLPHVPLFQWTAELPKLPFAGLLAASGQYLFPKALKAAGEYLDRKGATT